MINSYFIRSINGQEVLYLNFDFSYEFSSFDFMAKREKIQEIVRDFIRNNKVTFKGATVLLVSGGVLFGSILLNTPNYSGSPINSIQPVISSVNNDDTVVPNNSVIDTSNVVMDPSSTGSDIVKSEVRQDAVQSKSENVHLE